MACYAHFDPTQPAPQRVLGWYDTKAIQYPKLPSPLIEVPPDVWDAHATHMHGWVVNNGVFERAQPPERTLAQRAQAAMNGLVTVTCTSIPALNGDYVAGHVKMTVALATAAGIKAGFGMPGGGSTFNWPDFYDKEHQWPETQFLTFAIALRDFVYACEAVANGKGDKLPDNRIVID